MICLAWEGFPQYAARCVRALVDAIQEEVVVAATRPDVPIQGMEGICNCRVVWVEPDDRRTIDVVLGNVPRVIFSGWSVPVFNRWRRSVHRSGGRVIGMCDNNYMLSPKEIAKSVRFRLMLRGSFDGFFVPGRSGIRLLRFYGVPANEIATGFYSADASLFSNGRPLTEREKKLIYVGQFIERKNVRRLVKAFAKAVEKLEGWTLELYGSGPLRAELDELAERFNTTTLRPHNSDIRVHSFVQPEHLAGLYQSARLFCLPSLREHWGLVVHEAALSGCPLLLSKNVGSAADFLKEGQNGWAFDPFDVDDMARVLRQAMEADDESLLKMQRESVRMSQNASLAQFVSGVRKLMA